MANPFTNFDAFMNDYVNRPIVTTPQNAQQATPLAPNTKIKLGLPTKFPLILARTSIVQHFTQNRFSCLHAYRTLEGFDHFLPPYRSKPISFNYLAGVAEEIYFSYQGPKRTYEKRLKIPSATLYYEILKIADRPIGYDISALPPKKYLCDLLYTLNPAHPFFQPDFVELNFECDQDSGIFVVPISCRGLITSNPSIAMMHTIHGITSRKKGLIKKLNQSSEILQTVETIKGLFQKLQTKMSRLNVFTMDPELIKLKQVIDNIE